MLYQDKQKVDNVMFTCCVLHNMLLSYDYDHIDFSDESPFLGTEGTFDEEDIGYRLGDSYDHRVARDLDCSGRGCVYANFIDLHPEREVAWHELRECLVEHYWRRLLELGQRRE
mmetsp:Transcript_36288/g.74464  ORF Transcript_36288/g.74464 Transcript_36288/m.74464 type:complete len:114 (+) Transcript_36288:1159-1500(+)